MSLPKNVKNIAAQFVQGLINAQAEINKIDEQIAALQHRRNVLVNSIDGGTKAIEQITHQPAAELIKELFLDTPNAVLRSDMTIGDAIATILSNEGPQFQKDIIERI